MPKQKTRKSALKRFKITGTGKILHRKQYSRHRKSHKSSGQKQRAKRMAQVQGREKEKVKRMLGIG